MIELVLLLILPLRRLQLVSKSKSENKNIQRSFLISLAVITVTMS
jgi:hypothetical protein